MTQPASTDSDRPRARPWWWAVTILGTLLGLSVFARNEWHIKTRVQPDGGREGVVRDRQWVPMTTLVAWVVVSMGIAHMRHEDVLTPLEAILSLLVCIAGVAGIARLRRLRSQTPR